MTKPVRVASATTADVVRISYRDEALRAGWGSKVVDDFEYIARQIGDYPDSYYSMGRHYRHAVMHDFPFNVVYRICADRIEIIGVFPARADPALMTARMEEWPR